MSHIDYAEVEGEDIGYVEGGLSREKSKSRNPSGGLWQLPR